MRYLEEAAEKGFGPEATGEAMACLSKRRAELVRAAVARFSQKTLEQHVFCPPFLLLLLLLLLLYM